MTKRRKLTRLTEAKLPEIGLCLHDCPGALIGGVQIVRCGPGVVQMVSVHLPEPRPCGVCGKSKQSFWTMNCPFVLTMDTGERVLYPFWLVCTEHGMLPAGAEPVEEPVVTSDQQPGQKGLD